MVGYEYREAVSIPLSLPLLPLVTVGVRFGGGGRGGGAHRHVCGAGKWGGGGDIKGQHHGSFPHVDASTCALIKPEIGPYSQRSLHNIHTSLFSCGIYGIEMTVVFIWESNENAAVNYNIVLASNLLIRSAPTVCADVCTENGDVVLRPCMCPYLDAC